MTKSFVKASVVALVISSLPLFSATNILGADKVKQEIEAIKARMEEVERKHQEELQELQNRLQQLEQKNQQLEETQGLQSQVLKEVKPHGEYWWEKIEVTYDKGTVIRTKDGKFLTKIRLRPQIQFSMTNTEDEDPDTESNFDIRRMRLKFDGNAFTKWLTYEVQVDFEDSNRLLRDAYFDAAYDTRLIPRGGQYKVPFTREQLNSSSELQLVDRSILDEEFGFGRDRGAGLYGVIGNYLAYGGGVFNGDGRNGASADSNLLYAGRVMFFPCCGALKYKVGSFPISGGYKMEPNFGVPDKPLIAIGAAVAGIPGLRPADKTPDNDLADRVVEIFEAAGLTEDDAEADVFQFTADLNFKYSIFL